MKSPGDSIEPRDLPSTLRGYFCRHWRSYAAGASLILGYQVALNQIDWLSRSAVDGLFRTGDDIGRPLLTMGALGLVAFIMLVGGRVVIAAASLRIDHELRNKVLDRLHRLGPSFYGRHAIGELTSRALVDTPQVQVAFSAGVLGLLNSAFAVVTSLVLLMRLSPALTLAAAGSVPLLVVVMRFFSRRLVTAGIAVRRASAHLEGIAQRHFAGIRVIRGLAIEDAAADRFERATAVARVESIRRTHLRGLIPPITNLVSAAGLFVVFVYGAHLLRQGRAHGGISPGDFFAFLLGWTRLTRPFFNLGMTLAVVQQGRASFESLREILDSPVDEPPVLVDSPPASSVTGLVVRNLSLGVATGMMLEDISFDLPAGQSLAVVGRTGAGKSTLAQVIVRLLATPRGSVYLGGRDVCAIEREALRAQVGYAPQEAFLFSASVADNVALGRTGAGGGPASNDEIVEALRDAQVLSEVESLAEGIHTTVGERGLQLSGGQRQRVALARALLSDVSLLVLDDPLSAVDAHTEAAILDALRRRMVDRSIMLVTNRVAAASRCDRVLVLDRGRIAQLGTHAELLAQPGLYAQLAARQHLGESDAALAPMAPPASAGARADSTVAMEGAVLGESAVAITGQRSVLRRIAPHLRDHRAAVVAVLAFVTASAIVGQLRPWAMGRVTAASAPGASLIGPALLLTGAILASQLLVFGQTFLAQVTGSRVTSTLRLSLFRQASRFGMRYFDRAAVGRLVTRVVNDPETIGDMFSLGLLLIIGDVLSFLAILAITFVLDWRLAIGAFASLPVSLLAVIAVRRPANRRMHEANMHGGAIGALLTEQLSGMAVIQSYGREREMAGRFDRAMYEMRRATLRLGVLQELAAGIVDFTQNIATIGLLAACALVPHGSTGVTMVALIVLAQYVRQFFEPAAMLVTRVTSIAGGLVSARRVFELLDASDVELPSATEDHPVATSADEAFVFDHVDFSYRTDRLVLRDVSLDVRRGQRIALVGPTGAGKSTILQLLLRMYDVDRGAVRVLGKDVRAWNPQALRRSFAVVPQEVLLFGGTILDNIALGDPVPDRARAITALERIGVRDRFLARSGGLDAPVDERGLNFSVGERQLLSFARAMYREAPIVVLDEATASIDSDTEAQVQHAFNALVAGRTALVVAHRLSTIESCDCIVVFDGGRIVETGTHAELVRSGGRYARLHALQVRRAQMEQLT